MKKSLTTRAYTVPFILVTSLFFLWGFARAILDVLNKHFQDTLDVDITQSAMIQVVTYLGYFLMAIPAGMFINRFGYRRGVVFGLSLFAAGAFLFIPSAQMGTLNAFLVCLFIIACGLAFLETSANPYVTELGPEETSTSRLNLSQSFNGMGSFLAPLIVGHFLFGGGTDGEEADVTLPYLVMGVFVVLIAIIFSMVKLPEIKSVTSQNDEPSSLQSAASEGERTSSFSALLHNPMFMLGLLALLCYEIGEISINSYFVIFTTDMGGITSKTASYILSLGLVVFMVGRFIGSALMLVMRAETMLLLCASGSVTCMAFVLCTGAFAQQGAPAWVGVLSLVFLIANYLFESIMFPTIFSLALAGLKEHTKTGSSLLMMTPVGGCGFLLVAWIADATTPVTPFVIPLLAFLVVWIYAWRKLRAIRS
ncbi:MAG: sugar MFS transporter [Bacteroidaceae bacterium]|nr:sugar MFS transporter [Bacteroidaceae bacterium]